MVWCILFSDGPCPPSETASAFAMRIMKTDSSLFTPTLHRYNITTVLILCKLNKQRLSEKIFEKQSYLSLKDLHQHIIASHKQELMAARAKSGYQDRRSEKIDWSVSMTARVSTKECLLQVILPPPWRPSFR